MKKLGFGLMRLPLTDVNDYSSVDVERVRKMADEFLANGFTYFDTAAPYHAGNSETAFREAVVRRYPRSAYTITDKLTMFMIQDEKEIPGFFDAQLERLGVEFIDYYWLHALGEASYRQAQEMHAFEFLQKLKAEGKVRHIGFSFHDKADLLDRILTEHPEMEYVQLQLNYLDWDDENIQSGRCYEVAARHGKPVIVMEPVKGGALADIPQDAAALLHQAAPGMSIPSWAVRFAASHRYVMMVLSGMSSEEQMKDNLSYMKDFRPLEEKEMETVRKAAELINARIAIPCTACRYCLEGGGCPKNIAIPDCFAIYNNLKRFGPGQATVARTYYGNLIQNHGRASECLKCGQCESRCPQHLTIRSYLADVAAALE